ncbi:alpha/beta fold hydrolase [Lacipirellula limnantheis]|uniref:Alpha/beta hydrolase family protein n=1 Tax=Lacipirellula limnantheis TaxID=2528024 RepID=A0A517U3F5_9BACT|nr:alpha/beta hydrolase [Lacipirellula limnantheis]QDT75143.1 Alpha/beta hydrolase family protein [Lacipirellula limnantheis]
MPTRRQALVAGLTLFPTSGLWRYALGAHQPQPAEGQVRLPGGRRIGYAEYGDRSGPLVFYFHGTPGSRVEAGLIAEEATAAGIRLVALERPGIGLSDYQAGRQILNWPADVASAAQALGYGGTSFGIVGLSGGAPYALACVRCMPERLTHVAVVSGHTPLCPSGAPAGEQDKLIAWVGRRPRLATLAFRVAGNQLRKHPKFVLHKVAASWAESDRQLILCNAEYYAAFNQTLLEATRCGPAGIVADVTLLGSDWGFRLRALPPAAVSFWQGGCDPIAPPAMGHYFQQNVAGSELTIDPRAGHLTMLKWHAATILGRFAIR